MTMDIHLFEVSQFQAEGEINPCVAKYVAAGDLEDLIKQSTQLLGLSYPGKCDLVSPSGITVENDMILKLLVAKGISRFYVREKPATSRTGSHSPSAFDENPPSVNAPSAEGMPEDGQEPMDQTSANPDVAQQPLPVAREPPTGPVLPMENVPASTNKNATKKKDFYPIGDIIRNAKRGKRSKQSADQLIENLKRCEPKNFTAERRKEVHKTVGPWLMANCLRENYPDKGELIKMAESIVDFFPNAAPSAIWCSEKGRGTLERYIRNKRKDDGIAKPSQKTVEKRGKMVNESSASYSEEEVKQAADFMRRNVPTETNKAEMMAKFAMTRSKRVAMVADKKSTATQILKCFPRLMDTFEAVEYDLYSLKEVKLDTFVDNWRKVEANILSHARQTLTCEEAKTIIGLAAKAEEEFETHLLTYHVVELLLFMLPNTLPAFKKTGIKTADSIAMIIQKFEEGTDVKAAVRIAQDAMKQPGIIMIGSQFFLKIEELAITFPGRMSSLECSIACLVALCYILDIHYPEALKFVFIFFEHLFPFRVPSVDSTAVKLFLSHVKPRDAQ